MDNQHHEVQEEMVILSRHFRKKASEAPQFQTKILQKGPQETGGL